MVSANDAYFSDDEEDLCPLCVEEMDISDKNFKPCPCGYQICQFCYNNIRQNPELNGLCPACRRPYDDESVEYRQIPAEELRRDHLRQARKEKERKLRERERRDFEASGAKKHLAGMRVIQKNLVYVIGLNPNIPTEELQNALRQDQFFGQYGKILKVVVNKRTNASGHPNVGVYVTFARKEDATKCIAAVDGSINDGKILRAAYGTTKYCSSYLRGQTCPNPNCMFLHEPGEEADSYTRKDLSSIHSRNNRANAPQPMPSIMSAVAALKSGQAIPSTTTMPATPYLPSLPSSQPAPASAGFAPISPAPVTTPAASGAWVRRVSTPAVPDTASEPPAALRTISRCLELLGKHQGAYEFSSNLVNLEDIDSQPTPLYFTLSMDESARQAAYISSKNKLAELRPLVVSESGADAIAGHENIFGSEAINQPDPSAGTGHSISRQATRSPVAGQSPSPAPKAQNSHELLNRLLKGKPNTIPSQSVY